MGINIYFVACRLGIGMNIFMHKTKKLLCKEMFDHNKFSNKQLVTLLQYVKCLMLHNLVDPLFVFGLDIALFAKNVANLFVTFY